MLPSWGVSLAGGLIGGGSPWKGVPPSRGSPSEGVSFQVLLGGGASFLGVSLAGGCLLLRGSPSREDLLGRGVSPS